MLFPTNFSVETVLGCNLKCVECAVGAGLIERKHGSMNIASFKSIMNKIAKYCKLLYLHIWGEPLLNKDILDIIRYAEQFTRTHISTNANMIDKEFAKDIVDSGVSHLMVSIDGATQETYAIYRRGGKLEKAMLGLTHLVYYSVLRKKDLSYIMPQFCVFDHNKHEMEQFLTLCQNMGLRPFFKPPFLRDGSRLKKSGIKKYERNISENDAERRTNMAACPMDNAPYILLDGSVVACCFDHNGVTAFGNIFTDSFETIWSNDKYVRFRENVKTGHAPEWCLENCLSH